jgi:site-specific DNA-methyltransferase (adenine-specific)
LNRSLFSSANGDWETPDNLYQMLDSHFHFDFDPCPNNPEFDGLSIKWGMSNYINPPYNHAIRAWIEKAMSECISNGSMSVFLLPSRTDTKWFHELVLPYASRIIFIKGRLKFKGATNSAPFPSMIVIFKPSPEMKIHAKDSRKPFSLSDSDEPPSMPILQTL